MKNQGGNRGERIAGYISGIKGLDAEAAKKAQERLDSLVKPPGSLGVLEEIALRLAGISGEMFNDVSKRCLIIMSSDNGVVEEGVASAPQSVTHTQTLNFMRGITGASVLARLFGTELIVADVGVNGDISHPGILSKKIRKSTSNIAKSPAMSRDEAEQAVLTGIEIVSEAVKNGNRLIGAGEMGIGNTTTSAAVLCAFTGTPARQAVGMGAGLSEEAYEHKISVVEAALAINNPDTSDAIDVLAKVGGFDIAAMAGVFIGAAYMRVPVVIDGFISMAAALAAVRLCPSCREFMIGSHASAENGFEIAAKAVGIEAPLRLGMRLGEGSGCPIMFSVIDAACAVMREMGTFEEADIDEKYLEEIGGMGSFGVKG